MTSKLKTQFKKYLQSYVKRWNSDIEEKKTLDPRYKIDYKQALHQIQKKAKEQTFYTKKGRPYHYSALEYYQYMILKKKGKPKKKIIEEVQEEVIQHD